MHEDQDQMTNKRNFLRIRDRLKGENGEDVLGSRKVTLDENEKFRFLRVVKDKAGGSEKNLFDRYEG